MIDDPYRWDEGSVARERAMLLQLRERQRDAVKPLLVLGARRRAFSVAGITATVGFGALCVATAVDAWFLPRPRLDLAAALLTAAMAAVLAFFIAEVWATESLRLKPVARSLADLRKEDPVGEARRWAGAQEAESFAWPLVGATLLLPLLLHALFVPALSQGRFADDRFAEWIRTSLMLVGHTHLLVAVLSARAAVRIASGAIKRPTVAALQVVGWGTLSATPTIFGAPIVALTGVIPLLLLFHWTARRARREAHVVAAVERASAECEVAAGAHDVDTPVNEVDGSTSGPSGGRGGFAAA